MMITIVSVLIIISLALFNQLFLYFSRRVGIAFRYDEVVEGDTALAGVVVMAQACVTDKKRLSAVSSG
jgi:hypothetical protein